MMEMFCMFSMGLALITGILVTLINRKIDISEDLKFLIVLIPVFLVGIWIIMPDFPSTAEITSNNITITPYPDHIHVVKNSLYKVNYQLREGVGYYVTYSLPNDVHKPVNAKVTCSKGKPKVFEEEVKDEDGYVYDYRTVFMCAGAFSPGERIQLTAEYDINDPYTAYGNDKALNWLIEDEIGVPIKDTNIVVNNAWQVITYPSEKQSKNSDGFGYIDRGHYSVLALIGINDGNGVFEHYRSSWKSEYEKASTHIKTITFMNRYGWLIDSILTIGFVAVVLGIIYWFFGRELEQPTTETLHYIPEKIKPWMVNYRYSRQLGEIDDDGIAATLLDWSEKGYIELGKDEVKLVKLPSDDQLDEFEKRYKRYLEYFAEDGVISKKSISKKVRSMSKYKAYEAEKIVNKVKKFKDHSWDKEALSSTANILIGMLGVIEIILGIAVMFFVEAFVGSVFKAVAIHMGLGVYLLVVAARDNLVFRRMSRDKLKKYYEWQAFRKLLGDYGMIKKYGPKDSKMWEDWLLYATALGVADKVLKVIGELGIKLPHIHIQDRESIYVMTYLNNSVYRKANYYRAKEVRRATGGTGASGGFGGGGSFAR